MPRITPRNDLPTHQVENQPPLQLRDLWGDDAPLRGAVSAQGGQALVIAELAENLSGPEIAQAGRDANRHIPELCLFDRGGRRLDEVRFHPAHHQLMDVGLSSGYSAIAWEHQQGGHATHAAMVYLFSQIEPGVCCPMTITYASIPALETQPDIAGNWRPKLTSRRYDSSIRPIAEKSGAILGMAMQYWAWQ